MDKNHLLMNECKICIKKNLMDMNMKIYLPVSYLTLPLTTLLNPIYIMLKVVEII
jgi:hypothetical protein